MMGPYLVYLSPSRNIELNIDKTSFISRGKGKNIRAQILEVLKENT